MAEQAAVLGRDIVKFVINITLHAADAVAYTDATVEALLDALHESDALEEIDASGSLASHDLDLELVVVAPTIDDAHMVAAEATHKALASIGAAVIDGDESFRKTATGARELAAL